MKHKITHLKVYQSIKIGNKEKLFFSNPAAEIIFDSDLGLIKITLDNASSYTSLANVAWFASDSDLFEEKVENEIKVKKTVSGKSKKGTSKKH